jgi:hypothetical protein
MRNILDKICRENQNNFLCSVTFLRKSCRLWGNVEYYDKVRRATGDNTIRRMRFGCWINKATNTHTDHYYVCNTAFPLQRLHERVSMWRHTYVACTVENFTLNLVLGWRPSVKRTQQLPHVTRIFYSANGFLCGFNLHTSFDAITTVFLKIQIFRNVTPSRLASSPRRLRRVVVPPSSGSSRWR